MKSIIQNIEKILVWFEALNENQKKHITTSLPAYIPFVEPGKVWDPTTFKEMLSDCLETFTPQSVIRTYWSYAIMKNAITEMLRIENYPSDTDDFLDWMKSAREWLDSQAYALQLISKSGLSESSKDAMYALLYNERKEARVSWDAIRFESLSSD